MSNSRRIVYVAVSMTMGLLGGLIVAEITIRTFAPTHLWEFRDVTSDWQPHSRLGWVQKPHLDVHTRTTRGEILFQTNSDGLTPATAQRERDPGIFRIMIFGDSTVVGRAVPQDQTVNAYLETFFKNKGISVEVINAGVQGYSTDQSLIRMEMLLPLYQPDVVIHAVCTNDFGGNTSGGAYGGYKPRFIVNDKDALQEIQPIENKSMKMHGAGFSHWIQFSAVYRMLQPHILKVRAKFWRWEERNLLGLAGEIYIQPEALEWIDWDLFQSLIGRMSHVAEDNGSRFILYAHPAIEEVWEPYIQNTIKQAHLSANQYNRYAVEQRLTEVSTELGITFIPLIDHFLKSKEKGPFHLLPLDPHCNSQCYQLTAQVVGDKILSSKLF